MDKKLIDTVKKLLSLAENNPNENEALAAAEKVQQLLAKNGLSYESVVAKNKEEIGKKAIKFNQGRKWRFSLASIVAQNFTCKCFLLGTDLVFLGNETDIDVCIEVFRFLYKVGDRIADTRAREGRVIYGTARGIYNAWVVGYVRGIKSKLDEQARALMIVVPPEVVSEFNRLMHCCGTTKKAVVFSKLDHLNDFYEEGYTEGRAVMSRKAIK